MTNPMTHFFFPLPVPCWHTFVLRLLIAALLTRCMSTSVVAQPHFPSFRLLHYNDESGMPSNDVTGFAEDARGNFWFSTQFGAVKFDGRNFTVFNVSNLATLTSNRIFAMGKDSAGVIFFSDENEKVHQVGISGQLAHNPLLVARKNILLSGSGGVMDIRAVVKRQEDSLRLSSPYQLHAGTQSPSHAFFVTAPGKAYFVVGTTLKYWNNGTLTTLASLRHRTLRSFMLSGRLYAIDERGLIHVFNAAGSLPATQSIGSLLADNGDHAPFDIRLAAVFCNGAETFLQYRNRLYSFHLTGEKLGLSVCLDRLNIPLAQGIHYSARHQTYIINTATDGFYLVKNNPFRTLTRENGVGADNSFLAAVEIRQQTIFTANGTMFLPDRNATLFPRYYLINTLLKDRKNQIWYARLDSLICVDSNFRYRRSFHLPDTYLTGITEDRKGNIWCITNNSLMRLQDDSLRFIYRQQEALSRTESICFMSDSTALIGTSKGLFRCNILTGNYQPVAGMSNKYVRNLYMAGDGKIWIGTYGNGFYCYDGTTIHTLPLDRNGHLSSSHCFVEDGNGFVWIPSNKGLFQAKMADLNAFVEGKTSRVYYLYHDKSEGFLTNEFNGGCNPVGIRLSDGRISLPSMNGLVVFDPMKVIPELPAGDLFLERVSADTIAFDPGSALAFPPGAGKLRFQISTPYFGHPANLQIEYRFKGPDTTWKTVPENGEIIINYLPAGKYEIEFRKPTGFGTQLYTTLSSRFSIAPLWYESVWFRLSAAALLVMASYGFFRRRLQRLEARKRSLEDLVQRRTDELERSVEQLQNTVEDLKVSEQNLYSSNLLKEKLTSVVLHDIRTPVRFLNLLSKQLQSASAKNDQEVIQGLAKELTKTTGQLNFFTREFLVWLSSQQSGFAVRKEYIQVAGLCEEMRTFFQHLLDWNGNEFIIHASDTIAIWSDRQLLKIILHNLVDNANKHTQQGRITMEAFVEGSRTWINVADTGKGIPAEKLSKLQEQLESDQLVIAGPDADGRLGFSIIHDFAEKLKATVRISSEQGVGTIVQIGLP